MLSNDSIRHLPSALRDTNRWGIVSPVREPRNGPYELVYPDISTRREADQIGPTLDSLDGVFDRLSEFEQRVFPAYVFGRHDDLTLINWPRIPTPTHLQPPDKIFHTIRRLGTFTEYIDRGHIHSIVRVTGEFKEKYDSVSISPGAVVVPIWSLDAHGGLYQGQSRPIRELTVEQLQGYLDPYLEKPLVYKSHTSIPRDQWVLEPLAQAAKNGIEQNDLPRDRIFEEAKTDQNTGRMFKSLLRGHVYDFTLLDQETAPQLLMNLFAFWFDFHTGRMRDHYLLTEFAGENPVLPDGTTVVERRIARALMTLDTCRYTSKHHDTEEHELYQYSSKHFATVEHESGPEVARLDIKVPPIKPDDIPDFEDVTNPLYHHDAVDFFE